MPTVEARLREHLRNYAIEVRRLAYTVPNGIGERDLLRLSDQMSAAADTIARKRA